MHVCGRLRDDFSLTLHVKQKLNLDLKRYEWTVVSDPFAFQKNIVSGTAWICNHRIMCIVDCVHVSSPFFGFRSCIGNEVMRTKYTVRDCESSGDINHSDSTRAIFIIKHQKQLKCIHCRLRDISRPLVLQKTVPQRSNGINDDILYTQRHGSHIQFSELTHNSSGVFFTRTLMLHSDDVDGMLSIQLKLQPISMWIVHKFRIFKKKC